MMSNSGKYREALDVAEQQLKLLKDTYGVGHHEYATAMNNVATLYQALGRYAEAEPLLEEASKIQTRTLGNDDEAQRVFARYWRLIYPGSAIIRRVWLDAILSRASRTAD